MRPRLASPRSVSHVGGPGNHHDRDDREPRNRDRLPPAGGKPPVRVPQQRQAHQRERQRPRHVLHRTHPLRAWTVRAVPGEHNQLEGATEQCDGAADQEDPPRGVPRLAQHHQSAHHRNHIEQQRLERLTGQPELDQPDERRRRAQHHQGDPHQNRPGHPPPAGIRHRHRPTGRRRVHSLQPRCDVGPHPVIMTPSRP